MRLESKSLLNVPEPVHIPRIQRRFDDAQTPYDRLCAVQAIPPERQRQLDALRQQTNPRQLRQTIYHTIDQLFALPCSAPDQTQNDYLTLNLTPTIPVNLTT